MAWTGIARREHSRDGLRYPSDLTDREWALTAPFIPPEKSGGRRRTGISPFLVSFSLIIARAAETIAALRSALDSTRVTIFAPSSETCYLNSIVC